MSVAEHLVRFASNASCEQHVLGLDGDSFGVDAL